MTLEIEHHYPSGEFAFFWKEGGRYTTEKRVCPPRSWLKIAKAVISALGEIPSGETIFWEPTHAGQPKVYYKIGRKMGIPVREDGCFYRAGEKPPVGGRIWTVEI